MIGVLFILIWLISNRVASVISLHDPEGFKYIEKWYYWFQFCLFGVSILLTPKYTINEAIFFLIIFISLKIIIDKMNIFDVFIIRHIKK